MAKPDGEPPGAGLDDLGARIDRARQAGRDRDAPRAASAPPSGLGPALRLSTELAAGTLVGGGLGWFFDKALGTAPFGLICFLLIGFAAGTVNLVRAAARPGRDGAGGT